MTWFGYAAVCVFVLNSAVLVGTIGQPRDPLTPGAALTALLVNGLLVWGAVTVGTVHP